MDKTLKPIYDHDSYSNPIAAKLYSYFYETIFSPLLDILTIPPSRENAMESALVVALKTGKLRYVAPFFYGSLNATLSKKLRETGAVYNKTKKAYKLEQASLPLPIKVAIAEGNRIEQEKVSKVEAKLKEMEGQDLKKINLDVLFGDTLKKLDSQFYSTTKVLTRNHLALPIDQNLVPELKEAYTENLDKYIKDWHDTQILRLRKKVHQNVEAGFRSESLIETIMQEKRVSKDKARFLARNETSLLTAKYRQIRYEEIGIDKYEWSAVMDKRTRHLHKELNGKIFDFRNPPIIDAHTGQRGNPGETYNCRCLSIPIIPQHELLKREFANV